MHCLVASSVILFQFKLGNNMPKDSTVVTNR